MSSVGQQAAEATVAAAQATNNEATGGGCPMMSRNHSTEAQQQRLQQQQLAVKAGKKWHEPDAGMLYGEYLQLEQLLACQAPVTRVKFTQHRRVEVHDEHLFIITHQAYELWFKQIIIELDSVRSLLSDDKVDEANMLKISSRLNRIIVILKLLTEQFTILETMTPLDFMDFRDYLAPASGFQSVQFRLIENKLGIKNELRTNYKSSNNHYLGVFKDPEIIRQIRVSESEPSLCQLIERWLERTPGLEPEGFNFWQKYHDCIDKNLDTIMQQSRQAKQTADELKHKHSDNRCSPAANDDDELHEMIVFHEQLSKDLEEDYKRKKALFDSIFDQQVHQQMLSRGERRFSHKAMQGALMISLYRDEPRFNQPWQLMNMLVDIDAYLTKWRQNHAQMVLRMIGSQQVGTGGSSGYHYLRTTISVRYNVFVDLCNLSTFLIPRDMIPELTPDMKKRLSSNGEPH
ncbi:Tryptophan 2,3-dioxygenase, partial [Fragariocoptes setiger]